MYGSLTIPARDRTPTDGNRDPVRQLKTVRRQGSSPLKSKALLPLDKRSNRLTPVPLSSLRVPSSFVTLLVAYPSRPGIALA